MSGNILSLLGLALRGGRLVPGDEPAALAAKTGQARLLLAASDASDRTLRRAESLAREGHCLWLTLPYSKEELGRALGRASTAIAALTDTGLAAAVTERLAALDPERYGEAAARMDLKRRRAKERKAAPHRPPPGPPPKREDRRPPDFRRKGGPEGRPCAPKEGRGPDAWRDRRQDGGHGPGSRPGKPDRPYSGGKRRPHGEPPKKGRSRSYDGPPKKGQGRPQGGRPGGGRPQNGRPFKNRGGPRSGSGSPAGNGSPAGGGNPPGSRGR